MAGEVEVTEKKEGNEKKGIVVKMELPEGDIAEALETSVRSALFRGAVDHVLKQATPELMGKLIESILHEAFKGFSTWELSTRIKKEMSPMLEEVLKRPEILTRIRQATEQGVNEAIATLPAKVKETLIERAVTGMSKAWRE